LDQLNFSYSVPHFSNSFKEINGYLWESSEINILLLIKLYGIFLIARTKDIKFYHALLYIFMIEIALLAIFKKSSFISFVFTLFKKPNKPSCISFELLTKMLSLYSFSQKFHRFC
jgi:hypothetical protein